MSPAPWTFRGNGLRDAQDRVILLTVPASGLTVAEDDANRRLIESAPELKASLQDLLWMVGPNNVNETVARARELLAKLEDLPRA